MTPDRADTITAMLVESVADLAEIRDLIGHADSGTERAVQLAAETLADEAKRLRIRCQTTARWTA